MEKRLTYDDVEKKVKALRTIYRSTDDRQKVDSIEKDLRKKIAQSQLADLEIVQEIIAVALKQIESINYMLQYDDEITVEERKSLMKERKTHLFWIDRFDASRAQASLQAIVSFVDKKIDEANRV